MTKPFEQWQVLPHGKLTEIEPNILTVTGQIRMPLTDFERRMTVVRLRDSRLIIFSAISLDEHEMRAIEGLGRPAFLVVPNDHHRLDARTWKQRYPAVEVIAPEGSRAGVEAVVPVDSTDAHFDDPDVDFITVPGTRGHEAALLVRTPQGTTLVLNDLVGNMRERSGFGGWLLRVAGFAGDSPQIPSVVQLSLIADKAALRAQLLSWADLSDLVRIVVSHGAPIDDDPREVLRELAQSLE
ncbi:MAG: hypothetical protein ABI537_10345 [Casimicrobiaceae bacterium]